MRTLFWIVPIVALSSLVSAGQNNCSGSPAYGTCAAPAPPTQVWCAGNNSASTCPGGTSFVGFNTASPAHGSWTDQFEGLDAATIAVNSNPGVQADPVGGVGPTDSNGVGQYLQFAGNFVQAFDRATGNGIFAKSAGGEVIPQQITTLFSPGGKNYCINPSFDGFASYDRIDDAFVLGNLFKSGGGATTYYLCIGVSAPSAAASASNLEGTGGNSYWNVYVYNINPALPTNAGGTPYFPDYARYGTWSDGFYVSWDLEDPAHNYNIVGFEVCQLDKNDMVAGLSSNAPQCYTYIPNYVVGASGTDKSLIHTILPADFEGGNQIPPNTAGEYFLAQVNPSNAGTNNQCSVAPCTSNQLAFWTWSGLTSGAGPTSILLKYHAYTPGCYSPKSPANTYCIPQPYGGGNGGPTGGYIDSVGDRLMSRLAYRYIGGSEYLAVASTVQEASSTRRTGIRYYKILAGRTPSTVLVGDVQDTKNHYYLSVPSVAMDANGDLGITYTVTGSTAHGSASNYDPSPYFVTISSGGTEGTPVAILANSGSSGQDETDTYWGEYVSVVSDPNDDVTFWAVDEYMNGNQVVTSPPTCSSQLGVGKGCSWASRIFTCQKGSGC